MRLMRLGISFFAVFLYLLGSYCLAGRLSLSYPIIMEAETPEQREAVTLYWSVEKLFGEGHFEEAYTQCQRILESYSTFPCAATASHAMGVISEEMKNNKQAIDCYRTTIVKYPISYDALYSIYRLGRIYKQQGGIFDRAMELQKIMNVCDTVIAEAESTKIVSQAWFIKGVLFQASKRIDQMKVAMENAKTILPTSEFSALADFLLLDYLEVPAGESHTAVTAGLKTLIATHPNTSIAALAQNMVGGRFESERNFELAVEAYGKVLENFPNSYYVPKALLRLGTIEWSERRQKGQQHLNELITKYPNTYEAVQAEKWLAQNKLVTDDEN